MKKLNFPYSLVGTVPSEASGIFQCTECVSEVMLIEQMHRNFVLNECCVFQCPRGPEKILCLVRRDPRENVASRDGVISKVCCLWYSKVIIIIIIIIIIILVVWQIPWWPSCVFNCTSMCCWREKCILQHSQLYCSFLCTDVTVS